MTIVDETIQEPEVVESKPLSKGEPVKPSNEPGKSNNQIIWVVVGIIILIGAYILWNYYQKRRSK